MKLVMCAVKDRQLGAFMTPFFVPSEGVAIRAFIDEVNRKDDANMLWRHPEDHDLYCLGTLQQEDAEFRLESSPRLLLAGSSGRKE